MNITAKHFPLTDAIQEYVEKKVTGATADIAAQMTNCDVEVDKRTGHKNGDVFHVRVHIQVPHGEIYAEETVQDLYSAIDAVTDDVKRQVRDRKEKFHTVQRQQRRTRRALKSAFTFLRGGKGKGVALPIEDGEGEFNESGL